MRAIRDKLFFDVGNGEFKLTEYLTALTENHYYGAGLIFGKKSLPSILFASYLNFRIIDVKLIPHK